MKTINKKSLSWASAAEYRLERELRGTQSEVAAHLGVQRETISRRETGDQPIGREAWLALLALPKKQTQKSPAG